MSIPWTMLWTLHLRTVHYKSVSIQPFTLTTRTEHHCVPFCDYSQVHSQYTLNIALYFNPQPTHSIVTIPSHFISCLSHCNIDRTYLQQLKCYNYKTQRCPASYCFCFPATKSSPSGCQLHALRCRVTWYLVVDVSRQTTVLIFRGRQY
jgi:hypothetical protein